MSNRKASFKVPPASVRDPFVSQEARRKKALEEQKRRRAERFDSSRQLDFFADLSLGPSDGEDDGVQEPVREGVAQFASLLPPNIPGASASTDLTVSAEQPQELEGMQDALPTSFSGSKKKGKGKRKTTKSRGTGKPQAQSNKPNKWADKCMYAELLEMTEDAETDRYGASDGIPTDLETAWVAVTPVPVGKRCLAITHAPSGIAGMVPNTTLRSRVLGKSLMKPFPSPLPPHTVIDCILDENWRDNGILHVLDVIKWKGQDIADCETPFRFWWRDTRLSELVPLPPPKAQLGVSPEHQYRFAYPTSLVAVPYHTDLSLTNITETLLPLSRASRRIPIPLPVPSAERSGQYHTSTDGMDVETDDSTKLVELKTETAEVKSDGMLLYVAQATYEPGTSPLSLWIPAQTYADNRAGTIEGEVAMEIGSDSPLTTFEKYIQRRLLRGSTAEIPEANMES